MASGTLPRRRSMTDAFLVSRNPEVANVVRGDLISLLEGMRQRNAHLDDFARGLPKLTESDLSSLGQSDSTCPICLTSLLAILAEEETALAMDSPAHPIEELGVTRLVRTCGHIFCRKDIRGWLYQGNTTCPTCRTPFIAPQAGDEQRARQESELPGAGEASFDAYLNNEVTRAFEAFFPLPGAPASAAPRSDGQASSEEDFEQLEEAQFEYDHDRSEFSGMYS
ncbi:hypothetical protein BD310DRAFT_844061 [Dichomitus squalens]|uniref:RING-type domain-containing protein n=1 Tax=Dichomitus squalens TaxID=114155 RepID=A0A4Q9Q504_9APHY|nr:hypothetical protein BD310DRAFT_844061 [Dichomitus squalens]